MMLNSTKYVILSSQTPLRKTQILKCKQFGYNLILVETRFLIG